MPIPPSRAIRSAPSWRIPPAGWPAAGRSHPAAGRQARHRRWRHRTPRGEAVVVGRNGAGGPAHYLGLIPLEVIEQADGQRAGGRMPSWQSRDCWMARSPASAAAQIRDGKTATGAGVQLAVAIDEPSRAGAGDEDGPSSPPKAPRQAPKASEVSRTLANGKGMVSMA